MTRNGLKAWTNFAKELGKLAGVITVAAPVAATSMVGAVREAAQLPQTSTENQNNG